MPWWPSNPAIAVSDAALDLDDRDAQARRVEDELLERIAALRDDEQAPRLAAGDERLLDGAAAGDELLVLAERDPLEGRRQRSARRRAVAAIRAAAVARAGRAAGRGDRAGGPWGAGPRRVAGGRTGRAGPRARSTNGRRHVADGLRRTAVLVARRRLLERALRSAAAAVASAGRRRLAGRRSGRAATAGAAVLVRAGRSVPSTGIGSRVPGRPTAVAAPRASSCHPAP